SSPRRGSRRSYAGRRLAIPEASGWSVRRVERSEGGGSGLLLGGVGRGGAVLALGGELLGVLLQLGLDGLELGGGGVQRLRAEGEPGGGEFLGAVLEVLEDLVEIKAHGV